MRNAECGVSSHQVGPFEAGHRGTVSAAGDPWPLLLADCACHLLEAATEGLMGPAARRVLFGQEVTLSFGSFATFLKTISGRNLGVRMKSGNGERTLLLSCPRVSLLVP